MQMIKVKTWVTEVLMDVTQSEMEAIAKEVYVKEKSKAAKGITTSLNGIDGCRCLVTIQLIKNDSTSISTCKSNVQTRTGLSKIFIFDTTCLMTLWDFKSLSLLIFVLKKGSKIVYFLACVVFLSTNILLSDDCVAHYAF